MSYSTACQTPKNLKNTIHSLCTKTKDFHSTCQSLAHTCTRQALRVIEDKSLAFLLYSCFDFANNTHGYCFSFLDYSILLNISLHMLLFLFKLGLCYITNRSFSFNNCRTKTDICNNRFNLFKGGVTMNLFSVGVAERIYQKTSNIFCSKNFGTFRYPNMYCFQMCYIFTIFIYYHMYLLFTYVFAWIWKIIQMTPVFVGDNFNVWPWLPISAKHALNWPCGYSTSTFSLKPDCHGQARNAQAARSLSKKEWEWGAHCCKDFGYILFF